MYNSRSTLDDLLMDDQFVQWVIHPTPKLNKDWETWLAKFPHQKNLVEKARIIVQETYANASHASLSDEEVQTMWHQLQARHQEKANRSLPLHRLTWLKVAASFAGILMFSALIFWWRSEQMLSYQTAYGETKEILLPDSSTVMLNANSTLTLEGDWGSQKDRKVQLSGEAYFNVRHTREHRKFLVQTNSVEIEVLGTTFNVNQRNDRAQVVLTTGKVTLHPPNKAVADQITMKPGDLVELDTEKYIQKQVDVAEYTSWTDKKLIFNGTPLADIAQTLKDNYGLEVILADTTLARKRFHGQATTDNLESLLGQLEKVFQLSIERHHNQVVFYPQSKK